MSQAKSVRGTLEAEIEGLKRQARDKAGAAKSVNERQQQQQVDRPRHRRPRRSPCRHPPRRCPRHRSQVQLEKSLEMSRMEAAAWKAKWKAQTATNAEASEKLAEMERRLMGEVARHAGAAAKLEARVTVPWT